MELLIANTMFTRARGLLGRRDLRFDSALLFPRTRSVHTIGMRFALDLVWLDRHGAVVRIDRDVGPGRLRSCRQARSVLECAAGAGDVWAAYVTAVRPTEP